MEVAGHRMAEFLAARERQRRAAAERYAQVLRASVPALASRLRTPGAQRVWLFGSLVWGTPDEHADIDLAVEGLPPEVYFRAVGELLCAASASVDLVELERAPAQFAARIRNHGVEVVEVAP